MNEPYMLQSKAMNIEMKAEVNIRGAVLLVAISLSIPLSNQTGMRMMEPPIPSIPPMQPAKNPTKSELLKYFSDILSYSFLKTKPSYSFLISDLYCFLKIYLAYLKAMMSRITTTTWLIQLHLGIPIIESKVVPPLMSMAKRHIVRI